MEISMFDQHILNKIDKELSAWDETESYVLEQHPGKVRLDCGLEISVESLLESHMTLNRMMKDNIGNKGRCNER